jgi:hypothetical protein
LLVAAQPVKEDDRETFFVQAQLVELCGHLLLRRASTPQFGITELKVFKGALLKYVASHATDQVPSTDQAAGGPPAT